MLCSLLHRVACLKSRLFLVNVLDGFMDVHEGRDEVGLAVLGDADKVVHGYSLLIGQILGKKKGQ